MGSVWRMLRRWRWHQSIICRTPSVSPMPRSSSVRMAKTGSNMPASDWEGLNFISNNRGTSPHPGRLVKCHPGFGGQVQAIAPEDWRSPGLFAFPGAGEDALASWTASVLRRFSPCAERITGTGQTAHHSLSHPRAAENRSQLVTAQTALIPHAHLCLQPPCSIGGSWYRSSTHAAPAPSRILPGQD